MEEIAKLTPFSYVDGFTISSELCSETYGKLIASKEDRPKNLLDQFIKISIQNDGSNPFFPKKDCWYPCIVKIRTIGIRVHFPKNAGVLILEPSERVTEISVVEQFSDYTGMKMIGGGSLPPNVYNVTLNITFIDYPKETIFSLELTQMNTG